MSNCIKVEGERNWMNKMGTKYEFHYIREESVTCQLTHYNG